MPGPVESRIVLAERSIEDLYRQLLDLLDQIRALRASQRANAQEMPSSAPPSGGGVDLFTCTVPSAVTGPATFQASLTAVLGGPAPGGAVAVTVAIPGPTVAGKMGYVLGDGSGHYVLISQSCT